MPEPEAPSPPISDLIERLHRFGTSTRPNIDESTGMLDLDGQRVLYVLMLPKERARRWGVVACPSMFEFSRFQPTEITFLRRAAASGFSGIYLEPPGMGDSDGSPTACTMEVRTTAALAAFSHLQDSSSHKHALVPCWFGARLGAGVAMLAAEKHDGPGALVAWDAVADGGTYWAQARRLARISAVAQKQRSFKDPDKALEESSEASFLWMPVTREIKQDLHRLDDLGRRRHVEGPAFVIAMNDEQLEQTKQRLVGAADEVYGESLGRGDLDHLGVAEAQAAIEPTLHWMSERLV